jgi:hypothetical protein
MYHNGIVAAIGSSQSVNHIQVATEIGITAASTATGKRIIINGIIRTNAAGTFIPQFRFSADPTGTITLFRNSFFFLTRLGTSTDTDRGSWA